jgi:aspartate/methionine/tyrosine aminotransferase
VNIFDVDKEAFGYNTDEDLIDLRFGDPVFMQPYWNDFNLDDHILRGNNFVPSHNISSHNHMGYLHTAGSDDLKQAIRQVHHKVGNADPAGKFIVLGVGASQLLSAAIYALSDGKSANVYAKPPFFSRFQQFTQFSGVEQANFYHVNPSKDFIEIVTLPNNPDATASKAVCENVIYDLCYNWPTYIDVVEYNEKIMIFSLAKATGHASTRVGWALVHDQDVADRMKHYVEMSTSGVSYNAMKLTCNILRTQANMDDRFTCFQHGQRKLSKRWEIFKQISKNREFDILNSTGMFAWCKMKEDKDPTEFFKENYQALVVNGKYMGMQDENHFRINLGTDVSQYVKLIENMGGKFK